MINFLNNSESFSSNRVFIHNRVQIITYLSMSMYIYFQKIFNEDIPSWLAQIYIYVSEG